MLIGVGIAIGIPVLLLCLALFSGGKLGVGFFFC
jgi:hypothetical protein